MFTKNWYKFTSSIFSYSAVTCTNVLGNDYNPTIPTGSKSMSYAYKYDGYDCPSLHYVRTSYSSAGGVVFGTGTTPSTIDDYCLSGDVVTDFSYSSNVSSAVDANGVTTTALYTVTNNSSEGITIGEIGLMTGVTSAGQANKMLLERTVLESPVTIPAGGVGQVTYTIRFNYPTA